MAAFAAKNMTEVEKNKDWIFGIKKGNENDKKKRQKRRCLFAVLIINTLFPYCGCRVLGAGDGGGQMWLSD